MPTLTVHLEDGSDAEVSFPEGTSQTRAMYVAHDISRRHKEGRPLREDGDYFQVRVLDRPSGDQSVPGPGA